MMGRVYELCCGFVFIIMVDDMDNYVICVNYLWENMYALNVSFLDII